MPTNRRRKFRTRNEGNEIQSFIKWHVGMWPLLDVVCDENPWDKETAREFWKKYRDEIIKELEREYPRREKEKDSEALYLQRLDLLKLEAADANK